MANVLGEEVCKLGELAQSTDSQAARDLQLKLVGPNSCVSRSFFSCYGRNVVIIDTYKMQNFIRY